MSGAATRVFVPLTVRRRNGRPKILPPEIAGELQWKTQDSHTRFVIIDLECDLAARDICTEQAVFASN